MSFRKVEVNMKDSLHDEQNRDDQLPTVSKLDLPVDAPRKRHTRCGDLIEFDYAWNYEACDYFYDANGEIAIEPACKTCGAIPANEVYEWRDQEGMGDLITIVHQAGKIARLEAKVERLQAKIQQLNGDEQ